MESFFQFNKASLGQVYKAKLKYSGQHVAVKVQRPGIEEAFGLDFYLIRGLGIAINKYVDVITSDVVALIDKFARRVYQELNYVQFRSATDLPATLSVSSIGQLDQATNFSPKSLEMSTPPTEEEINTTEKEIAEAQPLKKSTKRALFQHTTNIEGDSIIKKPKHKG
ncbi:ABC1-like kinase [Tanacetum coccineum]